MPVVVEPHDQSVAALLPLLPAGSQVVGSPAPLAGWLDRHPDEYVVVVGPGVDLETALTVSQDLRTARPTVSVVLVVGRVDTAVLVRAMKAGARDVVALGDTAAFTAAVRQAYDTSEALRGPSGARHVGRLITVFSPKGGVGKTTVAVNLALALSEGGARRVCLVDLDLAFGDVAITMQLSPTHTIEQAIGSEVSLDLATVEGLLTRHEGSLMVLAAPLHPDVRERVTPALVVTVLRTLKESFDFVVVDTPPSLDDQILTALDETDECIVVAGLDVPTLKNVKVALETLDVLNIARGHRHLVLNRADEAVGIDVDRVQTILQMPVSAQLPSSLAVAAATNSGTPILAREPGHPVSQAVRRLAASLSGVTVAPPTSTDRRHAAPAPRARRRMFGRGRRETA
ncbi:AAA family ATPase [Nocardioides dongxiaopingii]|uniref:AAA family ATPase n=1 Tax=Nocardioides sp. S-1144 TaxID=2582905 RepID=UPI00110E8340|nr:P-loop NTPase [Nocardioides sp. S-1144]QCW51223.1 AAA family ATPase [Nocardioides sp. S-1144]